MRAIALVAGSVVIVIGAIGLVAPDLLLAVGRYAATTAGLLTVGAVRIALGLLLIGVSRASRFPRTLRGFGAVLIVAGVITPLFGVARTNEWLDWVAAHGTRIVRVVALAIVALASLFLYALSTTPRPRP